MKAVIIFFLISPLITKSQINYSSKTSFKYSKEDGWTRIIEKEWFTVNNNGDTTYWSQVKEDTQQDDPGIKKDSLPVLIPNSVFKIGEEIPVKDTLLLGNAAILFLHNNTVDSIRTSFPKDSMVIHKKFSYWVLNKPNVSKGFKYKTRWKSNKPKVVKVTKYKTRWKSKKPIVVHERKPPVKHSITTIKAITYKKKLWCVLSRGNNVYVVEANTIKGAMKKVGLSAVSATQFSDFTIIR